jgi:hypothetical protein
MKEQIVPQDESSSESCLHCEINDLVQEHIEGQESVDIVELVAKMAESLVELVLLAPEEEQARLPAATIAQLGQAFLEKSGTIEGDSDTAHRWPLFHASASTKICGALPRLRRPVLNRSFRLFCGRRLFPPVDLDRPSLGALSFFESRAR